MNDRERRRMVQRAVKKKFGSHKVLLSKRPAYYPAQAEREFQRLTDGYMRLLHTRLKEYLPLIRSAAKKEQLSGMRNDGLADFLSEIVHLLAKLASDLREDMEKFALSNKIKRIAGLIRRASVRQWKKNVKATLGIDLLEDYYEGGAYEELLQKWVEENIALIQTLPQESLGAMQEIILESYRSGEPTADIVRKIQNAYNTGKRHARLIARDQTAKLNAQISKKQQTDAGIREYIWSDSGDSRVRESHRALNNKRFRWDDPPVVDAKTGRRCHPGEDYQCRCVPLPVFEYESIDLPLSSGENK